MKLRKILAGAMAVLMAASSLLVGPVETKAAPVEENAKLAGYDWWNNTATAKSEAVDLIDVEWFMKDLEREALVKTLHEEKKIIVASNHHFHETPSVADMEEILQVMEDTEADIRKLAVMPSEAEDVLKLLIATVHANKTGEAPVITMSMSGLGAVSRVCGQVFGSVVTFGTVGAASAPGQLEITQLRRMLEQLQP